MTVEALASEVAHVVLNAMNDYSARVVVRISKPSAIIGAESAEVEVTRTLMDFNKGRSDPASGGTPGSSGDDPAPVQQSASLPESSPLFPHRAAIAVGANIGDRFANIETALRLLEPPGADLEKWAGPSRVAVVDTSFMYETSPMYVEDQPKFINCACMVSVSPRH